jgi:multiple sugar transport system permease protein
MTAEQLVNAPTTDVSQQPRAKSRLRAPKLDRSRPAQKRSLILTLAMAVLVLYSLVPVFYLLVNSTKSQASFRATFGLWFGGHFDLFANIREVFTYDGGIFGQWFSNTLLYVVVGGGGATILATMAGYGLAKFVFPGKKAVFALILGSIAIPGTALAVPTFLLFSDIGITNTPWAVILPSLISPFGLYLVWTYAQEAIPTELLEAARIDGAGELRTFFSISIKLLSPGVVTVLLFSVVATWNNYFLPLIMLSDPRWYPLTVGLSQWNAQSNGTQLQPIYNLVITGSLITIVPLVIAFLFLQRFWQSGLSAGSVKQ